MSEAVAVIIPAYNQAAFVREAVESVFRQTVQPLQVIVINDGSTDDTSVTLAALAKEHPLLTVLEQENSGVCVACNRALEKVETPLVLRLDGDDFIPDDYIEQLLGALRGQRETVAFAYCDAQYFGSREGWMCSHSWSIGRLMPENYIHVSSLLRIEAVRKVGYFNENMKAGFEDWDFYLALAEAGYSGVYCRDTFLWYRQREDAGRNIMTPERDRKLRAQLAANHPKLFGNPLNQLRIFFWRVRRRLRHLLLS